MEKAKRPKRLFWRAGESCCFVPQLRFFRSFDLIRRDDLQPGRLNFTWPVGYMEPVLPGNFARIAGVRVLRLRILSKSCDQQVQGMGQVDDCLIDDGVVLQRLDR